jgi:dihydrofolate reductase
MKTSANRYTMLIMETRKFGRTDLVAEEVSKLRQQPSQNILVAGSGTLAHTLMQHDLVDEYRLMVHPVVLGTGKRLFRDGSAKTSQKLVETKTSGKGIVILHYQPDQKG